MNELDDDAAPDPSDFSGATPGDGVGLCLSGGGYRAMVFHLGVLRRFNETGWLQKLTRVASVSGGSIIAAQLGMAWKKLGFSNGVATNFDAVVGNPIRGLAAKTIDRKAILVGVLLPGSISQRVQAAYDKLLFHGATLQALPGKGEGPTFILLATNLSNAALWRLAGPTCAIGVGSPSRIRTCRWPTQSRRVRLFRRFCLPACSTFRIGRRFT